MILTKIEKQKKYKKRFNIFLDGNFTFGLYDDTIFKFGLRINDELSDELCKEIREYDEYNFGKQIAYAYLSYKSRSKKEVYQKLKSKKISDKIIEDIINLLTEQKYINDLNYSKLYLENKLSNKPIGKRLLKLKLMEKGIDKETTEKVIEESFNEETELESARKLLEKYSRKLKNKDAFDVRKKSFKYLVSRGFDFDVANEVLKLRNE